MEPAAAAAAAAAQTTKSNNFLQSLLVKSLVAHIVQALAELQPNPIVATAGIIIVRKKET